MGIFGWSYPAGCHGTPYDEDQQCEICGWEAGSCICPECPECGEQGNPTCYKEHGLVVSEEQIASRLKAEAMTEENNRLGAELDLDSKEKIEAWEKEYERWWSDGRYS